jgi:RNA polymerase sigma-70 factor (ECF subfamily)
MAMNTEDTDKLSDQELVKMAVLDQNAFSLIMKRYEKKLLAFIVRLSSLDHQSAEDVLQEIFIKVFRNLNDYDPKLKFSSWIYRIAHNETISHYRKIKSRAETVSMENDDSEGLIHILADSFDFKKDVQSKIVQ